MSSLEKGLQSPGRTEASARQAAKDTFQDIKEGAESENINPEVFKSLVSKINEGIELNFEEQKVLNTLKEMFGKKPH